MKMTIRKIAELAGTSRSAVDKVIHDRPGVSEAVRQEVLRVIEQTGYVPLHERRTAGAPNPRVHTVAVFLPPLNNPYFQALKRGMDSMAEEIPALRLEYRYFDPANVDGMLAELRRLEQQDISLYLIRGIRSSRLRDCLNAMGRPVIFVDSVVPDAERLCFIGEDCYRSGRLAASLLGKTVPPRGEIAVIGGSPHIAGHKLRMDGFFDVLRTHCPDLRVVEQLSSEDQGVLAYQRTLRLLDECNPCRPRGRGRTGDHRPQPAEYGQLVCYNITGDVAALIRREHRSVRLQPCALPAGRLCMKVTSRYTADVPPQDFIRRRFLSCWTKMLRRCLKKGRKLGKARKGSGTAVFMPQKSIPSDTSVRPFQKARLFCHTERAGAAKDTGRMRSFIPAFLLRFHTKTFIYSANCG